jgi:hypothetical protein
LRPLPPQNFLHAEMGPPSEMTAGFFESGSGLAHFTRALSDKRYALARGMTNAFD